VWNLVFDIKGEHRLQECEDRALGTILEFTIEELTVAWRNLRSVHDIIRVIKWRTRWT
jgi:hypothetical protein